MRVLIINGPNLNLLGQRDSTQYGVLTLHDIEKIIKKEYPDDDFTFFQSNLEGEIVTKIQHASDDHDGIIINPGGYSHTSVAIKDALEICKIPKVEVHLSNLSTREEYRKTLMTASACNGHLSGFREYSYLAGIYLLKKLLNSSKL